GVTGRNLYLGKTQARLDVVGIILPKMPVSAAGAGPVILQFVVTPLDFEAFIFGKSRRKGESLLCRGEGAPVVPQGLPGFGKRCVAQGKAWLERDSPLQQFAGEHILGAAQVRKPLRVPPFCL